MHFSYVILAMPVAVAMRPQPNVITAFFINVILETQILSESL
jgi:hypothetical protein